MAARTSIGELQGGNISVAFELEIGGLEVRYTSHAVNQAITDYTYVTGLDADSVTAISSEIDLLGGIGKAGNVTLRIAPVPNNANSAPLVLGRVTTKGADTSTTLTTTVSVSSVADVPIDGDPTGWRSLTLAAGTRYPFYIGQECFLASGLDTVAPYNFTGISREWFNSNPQEHVVRAPDNWAPDVTSHIVNWRGRPASLWITNRRPDGTAASQWIQYVSGFIDTSPQILADGTVEITIVPWLARLKDEIGGSEFETTLVHGYHDFTSGFARGISVPFRYVYDENAAIESTATQVGAADTMHLRSNESHQDIFDTATDHDDSRAGAMYVNGASRQEYVPQGYAIGTQYTGCVDLLNAPSVLAHEAGDATGNLAAAHIKRFTATESVQVWPGEFIVDFNAAMATGSIVGGDFIDLHFGMRDFRWVLLAKLTADKAKVGCRLEYVHDLQRDLWYGLNLMPPEGPGRQARAVSVGRRLASDSAGTGIGGGADSWGTTTVKAKANGNWQEVPTVGFANAFYQPGEKYLIVADNIYSGSEHWVLASWDEADYEGGPTETLLRITASDASTHVATGLTLGTRLTVDVSEDRAQQGVVAFGDWAGVKNVKVRAIAKWHKASPAQVALNILHSIRGDTTNGAFDQQPFGLGIPEADVDQLSILRLAMPAGMDEWTDQIREGVKANKIIGPMLTAANTCLTMRLDQSTGRRRIAATSVGLENKRESVGTITNAQWLTSEGVSSETDDRIVNRWEWKLNYSFSTGKFHVTVGYNDKDSVGEHHETKAHKEEFRGLRVMQRDIAAQTNLFRPLFSSRSVVHGQARRLFRGPISFSDAVLLDAGLVVTVTIDAGYSHKGVKGITSEPMRIKRIGPNPVTQECEIELVWHDANTTGYNAELLVESKTSATIVVVTKNAFAAVTDPITMETQTDLDFWAVNDAIHCIPVGDYASKVTTTISAINTGTRSVTTPVVHGLSVGDTIRPDTYDAAGTNAVHKALAYIANSSNQINAGAANGYVYDD